MTPKINCLNNTKEAKSRRIIMRINALKSRFFLTPSVQQCTFYEKLLSILLDSFTIFKNNQTIKKESSIEKNDIRIFSSSRNGCLYAY